MKKNILFITFDQWRGDTLGVVGHPHVQTPNFDQFAAEAVCFTKHFLSGSPVWPGSCQPLYWSLSDEYPCGTQWYSIGCPS